MKNIKTALSLLLLITLSFGALAQQEAIVLASAIETDKEKNTSDKLEVSGEAQRVNEGEEPPTFVLSGSVDAYYHSSFGSQSKAPNTSFANLNGFSLGMVNLIGAYDGEKVGFKGDLVFGPRGFDAVFANTYTGQRIVNQLYGYLKVGEKVTLNLGQFNTFFGYEVISPTGNFHYSTSYMFSWGPFNH
ncbi:MAG: outer membrane beta-barrel protein, partial [Bacteroidia bacterium]|nr:outer membrane beta-barrel protein [Bacteroidia bacterium]